MEGEKLLYIIFGLGIVSVAAAVFVFSALSQSIKEVKTYGPEGMNNLNRSLLKLYKSNDLITIADGNLKKMEIHVRNAFGGGVEGIKISASAKRGILKKAYCKSKGKCYVEYIPPKNDLNKGDEINITIQTSMGKKTIHKKISLLYPNLDKVLVDVENKTLYANGKDELEMHIKLKNRRDENLPAGYWIRAKIKEGSGEISPKSCTFKPPECTLKYKVGKKSGNTSVSITVINPNREEWEVDEVNKSVSFYVRPLTANDFKIKVGKSNLTKYVDKNTTITIIPLNEDNVAINYQKVRLKATHGKFEAVEGKLENDGNATLCLTEEKYECKVYYIPENNHFGSDKIDITIGNKSKSIDISISEEVTDIRLDLSPSSMLATANKSITINAHVESHGHKVHNGVVVRFHANGEGSFNSTTCTTKNGACSVTFRPAYNGNKDYTIEIDGEVEDVKGKATLKMKRTYPYNLIISTDKDYVVEGGAEATTITVEVVDINGKPVPNTEVDFESTRGDLTLSVCHTGDNGLCKSEVYYKDDDSWWNYYPDNLDISIYVSSDDVNKAFQNYKGVSGANINQLSDNLNRDITLKISRSAGKIRLYTDSYTNELPADGRSRMRIYADVDTISGSPVDDGTVVNFRVYVGPGELDTDHCTTEDGRCYVEYIAGESKYSETVEIVGEAGDAKDSVDIKLKPPEPKEIYLTLNPSTINSGDSCAVEATIKDEIGNGVAGKRVYFSANHGDIDSSCDTGGDGKCSVVYTSSSSFSGVDIIEASAGNLETSKSIVVQGSSEITATIISTSFGDPIIPAFAINSDYFGKTMVIASAENSGSEGFDGRMEISIPDYSYTYTDDISLTPNGKWTEEISLDLNNAALNNLEKRDIQYVVKILDNSGNVVAAATADAELMPANSMKWDSRYYNAIVAWVTTGSQEVHNLVSAAANRLPSRAFIGYGTYSSGCGDDGRSSCTEEESTRLQMKAIYDELNDEGMHYVSTTESGMEGVQRVYTPSQSLEANGANCIDGSLVYATALMSAGIYPKIILESDHAFVCVYLNEDKSDKDCVEMTLIGRYGFDDAVNTGNYEYSHDDIEKELDVEAILHSSHFNVLPI